MFSVKKSAEIINDIKDKLNVLESLIVERNVDCTEVIENDEDTNAFNSFANPKTCGLRGYFYVKNR